MTQFGAVPGNNEPHAIHEAEQMWGSANHHLQEILDHLTGMQPDVFAIAGGNTDVSVTFDFIKGYILHMEQTHGPTAHAVTVIMCAAALTRLVRSDCTAANDVLAELEKEITE